RVLRAGGFRSSEPIPSARNFQEAGRASEREVSPWPSVTPAETTTIAPSRSKPPTGTLTDSTRSSARSRCSHPNARTAAAASSGTASKTRAESSTAARIARNTHPILEISAVEVSPSRDLGGDQGLPGRRLHRHGRRAVVLYPLRDSPPARAADLRGRIRRPSGDGARDSVGTDPERGRAGGSGADHRPGRGVAST